MAFLSRLFKRGDPLAEREEARRQGMRDARRHPLTTFTDPQSRPAFVAEIRARAREQITEVHRRLAARRGELLERALAAREAILLELDRPDLLPHPAPNGSPAPGGAEDAFISIAEARWRRDEARRRDAVRASQDSVRRSGARIEQFAQEWENALLEHDQEVAAVHARAEQLIAAYRSGVMEAHPRREEIPALWQGEVIAMEPTGDTRLGISAREELVRILTEVETRVTDWHTQVLPRTLPSLEPPPSHRTPTALEPPPSHRTPPFDDPAQLSTSPSDALASSPDPSPSAAARSPADDPLETAAEAPGPPVAADHEVNDLGERNGETDESQATAPPDEADERQATTPPGKTDERQATAPPGGADERQATAPLRQDATPPGRPTAAPDDRRTTSPQAPPEIPSTSPEEPRLEPDATSTDDEPGPSRNTREHRRTYSWRAAFGDPSTPHPAAEDDPGQDPQQAPATGDRRTDSWRAAFGDPSTPHPIAEDHPGRDAPGNRLGRPSALSRTTAEDQPEPDNRPDDTAPGQGRNPGSEGEERRWRR